MTLMQTETTTETGAEKNFFNRLMMRFGSLLGLTTGIGVVAWGSSSLLITIGLTVYERSGLTEQQIQIEDAFNQGLLQSASLIALGAIILELRRISNRLCAGNTDG